MQIQYLHRDGMIILEEEETRVCAYLTQMLKLSYALQYHRKLRRIDGPARENGLRY